MSTLIFRVYICFLVASIVVVVSTLYVLTMMALVAFMLGVIYMALMGWYVDPIYIVIITLLFVFLFLARIDYRFKKIQKLLEGVNNASQTTSRNTHHLGDIAYNTTPELVSEYQRTGPIQVILTSGNLPPLDATQPIQTVSVVEAGTGMFYEQPRPASFCTNCGTPTRQTSGNLRPTSDRQWDYASGPGSQV